MKLPKQICVEFKWVGKIKSKARWAFQPQRKLVLFIHGFGGSHSTWNDFQKLMPESQIGDGVDLVFYCYDGTNTRAGASATLFSSFIQQLGTQPAFFINQTVIPKYHRKNDFEYESILIVAHSLGGVVSRLALLDIDSKQFTWAKKLKLLLFAPAHSGADIDALLRETFFIRRILPIAKFLRFKVMLDLEKAPLAQTLVDLKLASQEAAQSVNTPKNLILAVDTYFGSDENVVVPSAYLQGEPPIKWLQKKNHTSICKPKQTDKSPLNIVLKHLQ